MRDHHPQLLVLWGTYDPSFSVAGAKVYLNDVPEGQLHLLPGGHFALDDCANEVAELTRAFINSITTNLKLL